MSDYVKHERKERQRLEAESNGAGEATPAINEAFRLLAPAPTETVSQQQRKLAQQPVRLRIRRRGPRGPAMI